MKYSDKPEKWIEIGYVAAGDVPREALSVNREAPEGTNGDAASSYEIRDMNDVSHSSDDASRFTRDEGPIFYVRDNGIGIREKHLLSIFRMFKRLHGRDKYGGGTGAGLALTKKIVERMGGRIWGSSTYGEGTTFYFTLVKGT